MSIPPTNCLPLVKAPPPHLSSLFPSFAVSDQIAINGLFHFRSDWWGEPLLLSQRWLRGTGGGGVFINTAVHAAHRVIHGHGGGGGVEGNSFPQEPISYLVTNFFGPLFTVFPPKPSSPWPCMHGMASKRQSQQFKQTTYSTFD